MIIIYFAYFMNLCIIPYAVVYKYNEDIIPAKSVAEFITGIVSFFFKDLGLVSVVLSFILFR